MIAPLSWLKDFVEVNLDPEILGDKLTEVGLGTEKISKTDNDTIFEFEITPNRSDLLSIIGVAREIAAVQNSKFKEKSYELDPPKKQNLPLELHPNYKLFHRWTGIIISNIEIKPSSSWIQERLTKIGLRPINNIVDITNYVMYEFGIPLHAFDYDQIKGRVMYVEQAKGGERFITVDQISYSLPKGAIIIKDKQEIIDLAGIKGGLNSGITNETKNIFLHVTVDDPVFVRRASQNLGLRSDASSIYERGVDKGGTINSIKRAANLILENAGGELASPIIDLKKENFKPWVVKLSHEKLTRILGIDLDRRTVSSLLERLNLQTKIIDDNYSVTIPTYRNDLKIEEDLIEEAARLYGYNNFSKTIPQGLIPTKQVPYFKDYRIEEKAKEILKAAGFSEVYTYSLISEKDLLDFQINPVKILRVDNPVSKEFEYLRPSLKINLIKALNQNKPYYKSINLFELGKVYVGGSVDKAHEYYFLSAVTNDKNFYEVKGILEELFGEFGVKDDPVKYIEVVDEGIFFELNFSQFLEKINLSKKFKPLPKYPPIVEDLSIEVSENIKTKDIMEIIKKRSPLISGVSLLDQYEKSRTFHIVYQNFERNLTSQEVSKIREKIIDSLKEKFNAKLK